jgi:hypothetical protein
MHEIDMFGGWRRFRDGAVSKTGATARGLASRVASALALLLAAQAILGCASKTTSSGLIYRINPPGVSVQALRVDEGGPAVVTVRLSNFSTVATTFAAVDLELRLGGAAPITISANPSLEVPALSSDVAEFQVELPPEAREAIARAAATGALPYAIAGRITTTAPEGRHRVEFESRLSPVPGRAGEFR